MHPALSAIAMLLPAVLSAQTASYTYVDQKAPYKNQGVPLLKAVTLPRIGQTFTLEVPDSGMNCCPFYMNGLLATGARPMNMRFDALGGFLYASPDVVLPTPQGSPSSVISRTKMSFQIPNSPQLLGVRFYQQVLQTARNQFWSVTYLSRGGIGVIGR